MDPLSPELGHEPLITQESPSPLPLPVDEANIQESQAQEIQQQFQWLADMLDENKKRGWGTAYREFVDVLLLLKAAGGLGMVEQNNRVSDGVFSASTGDVTLNLATFIDVMDLEHTLGTWRNKLTTYFRLKSLYLYSQHNDGITFQDPAHQSAWRVVSQWMVHDDKLLQESWVTKRYGCTELRPLLRSMLQEAHQGECLLSLSPAYGAANTESRHQKVAWNTEKSLTDVYVLIHNVWRIFPTRSDYKCGGPQPK